MHKLGIWYYQRPVTISKSISGCKAPVRNLQLPPKPQMRTSRTWLFFEPSKSRQRDKNLIIIVSKTSDYIQIKIKKSSPSEEHTASSKAQNKDLDYMDVLCTFKIKLESQNFDHWLIKDQWPYPNQDPDAKSQSGTSSILQSHKSGLKEYGCSFHYENQDGELKLGT